MNIRILVSATSVAILAALAHGQDRSKADTLIVGFDQKTAALSVQAQGQPLSQLLDVLHRDHGVRVTVPGLRDRKLSIAFTGQPLVPALTALLGDDQPFQLDLGSHDIELPAPVATQPMPRQPESAQLPRMEQGSGVRADLPVRPEATAVVAVPPPGGRPLMPAGHLIPGNPIEGDGPALDPQQDGEAKEHACLQLLVQKDGTVAFERAFAADGPVVSTPTLVGDWIWELQVGGQVLAVGSLRDPLAIQPICADRPLDPRRRPVLTSLNEARIVLAADAQLLDPAVRGRATLRLLHVQDGLGLPTEFSLDTFAAFAGKARPLATLTGETLVFPRPERK
ncbi:MAG: hypothetical protein IPK26_05330 [Planctomycetes bacterium]|nr:hypothetical protein [Planctomycetota bacterium]